MQLEEDIFQIHMTERMAEHYYGLTLQQLVTHWESWEDVELEWINKPALVVCKGIRKVLDKILAWMKSHSGHNELPVLQEGVAPIRTGLRQIASERSYISLALGGRSQETLNLEGETVRGLANSAE